MQFQLTNAGVQALKTNPNAAPVSFKLGTAVNYVPAPTDTNLHGTVITTGTISAANQVNGNVLRYTFGLSTSSGPYAFGECGLFMSDGTLFALGAATEFQNKVIGQSYRIDAYILSDGTDFSIYQQIAYTSNSYKMGVVALVDNLPQGQDGHPQAYIVSSTEVDSYRAFSSGFGLWSFDEYVPETNYRSVVSATTTSLTFTQDPNNPAPTTTSLANPILIEFNSGFVFSTCRQVTAVVVGPGNVVTYSWSTPMTRAALAGDWFYVFTRRMKDLQAGSGIVITDEGSGDFSISATGILSPAQYTLTTLPAASTNQYGLIVVTNATGGPKLCMSDGTNWNLVNTTTVVS